jgi:hypothetical protein
MTIQPAAVPNPTHPRAPCMPRTHSTRFLPGLRTSLLLIVACCLLAPSVANSQWEIRPQPKRPPSEHLSPDGRRPREREGLPGLRREDDPDPEEVSILGLPKVIAPWEDRAAGELMSRTNPLERRKFRVIERMERYLAETTWQPYRVTPADPDQSEPSPSNEEPSTHGHQSHGHQPHHPHHDPTQGACERHPTACDTAAR